MPRYAVSPDDLESAAALTAGDGPALEVSQRLVVTAAEDVGAALSETSASLAAAVDAYAQVEAAFAAAVAEAGEILAAGLASAGSGYAQAEAASAGAFMGSAGDRP
jgi:replication-associated recombination protein RarA